MLATGLTHFESVPRLGDIPRELVSHTANVGDFTPFRDMNVAVIGAGQSALQAAALLHESGAHAVLLAREKVIWNSQMPKTRGLLDRINYPNTSLGPGHRNWVLEHFPTLIRHASAQTRRNFAPHLGPMGAWWLRDRVEGKVPTLEQCKVVTIRAVGNGLVAELDVAGTQTEMSFDHVVAGTGYVVDIERLAFLAPELRASIAATADGPLLSRHFESSVPGLHFIGPASVGSFGPLFRFVTGANYTVPTLARHLERRRGDARAARSRLLGAVR